MPVTDNRVSIVYIRIYKAEADMNIIILSISIFEGVLGLFLLVFMLISLRPRRRHVDEQSEN